MDTTMNLYVRVRDMKVCVIKLDDSQELSDNAGGYKFIGGQLACIYQRSALVKVFTTVSVCYPTKRVVYKINIQ